MKTKFILTLTAAVLCAAKTFAAPFGTAFTYQGRLDSGGAPFTGIAEFQPTLWDAASAGSQVAANNPASVQVPVTNGLFTATLDFGAAPFANGAALWLQLSVRTNMALGFTALTPRQPLTPTPYAITAGSLSGSANQTFNGTVNFSPAAGPPFAVNSTTKVSNLNADLLDGLDSTAFVKRAGDTMTGSLTVNSNLVVQSGLTSRATSSDGVLALKGAASKSRSWLGGVYAEDAAPNGNGLVAVATNGPSAYGLWAIAPQGKAAYLDGDVSITGDLTAQGTISGVNRILVNSDSAIATPHLSLHESQGTDYARLQLQAGSQNLWHIAAGGPNNVLNFYSPSNGNVMTLTTNGTLYVNVLTIRGGADLAEPFHIHEANLAPGTVVVIDDAETGHLRLSTRAYDTRVAGVVSGANGIKPGIMLQQEGVNAGGQNVALTGRVYAKATAKNGAIQPGDLLTTATLPGHAMKVTDPVRAQGAILGKAMSSLREGEGSVLVLVTLQ